MMMVDWSLCCYFYCWHSVQGRPIEIEKVYVDSDVERLAEQVFCGRAGEDRTRRELRRRPEVHCYLDCCCHCDCRFRV